jgi:hypothetical protein
MKTKIILNLYDLKKSEKARGLKLKSHIHFNISNDYCEI